MRIATVFPVYAQEDREIARELADFLQNGNDVQVYFSEGEVEPGADIVSRTAEGLSADVVLVLLSPESTRAGLVRAEWEPVFVDQAKASGTLIAKILLADCK